MSPWNRLLLLATGLLAGYQIAVAIEEAISVPVVGAYVIGAASGYGIMAAAALGELVAAHVAGGALPEYAPMFALSRYNDPVYQTLLKNWGESWQL